MMQLIVIRQDLADSSKNIVSDVLEAHTKLLLKFNLEELQSYLQSEHVTVTQTVKSTIDLLNIYVKAHELELPCVITQQSKEYKVVLIGPCSEADISDLLMQLNKTVNLPAT